jgi:hypothetical protein
MTSKYFELHEVFPRDLYNLLVNIVPAKIMWRMVNPGLVVTIDRLKEKFPNGSMTINNYKWNGDREWSGLRTKESKWYSPTSKHSSFDAIDAVFSAYKIDEVRNYVLENPDEFPEVGGIEMGTSWLHADVRSRRDGKIITFSA